MIGLSPMGRRLALVGDAISGRAYMSALPQSGPVFGQVNNFVDHHDFPSSETKRPTAKKAAQYLAEAGNVVIVVHQSSAPSEQPKSYSKGSPPCRTSYPPNRTVQK